MAGALAVAVAVGYAAQSPGAVAAPVPDCLVQAPHPGPGRTHAAGARAPHPGVS